MKTILVPTDFSETAENALHTAIKLARISNAKIQLLHIIEGYYVTDYNPTGILVQYEEIEKVYRTNVYEIAKNKMLDEIAKFDFSDIILEQSIEIGEVFESISSAIVKHNIDFIVMGMHGKDKSEQYAGQNTVKVVRKSTHPVLIVKDKVENPFRKVLLATDFETISKDYINKVKELQDILGFEIHLLFVNTQINYFTTSETDRLIDKFKEEYKLANAFYHVVNAYNEEDGVMDYSNKIKADVIALTTHGRKGILRFFYGSISEHIVKESPKTILSMKI